MQLLPGLSAFPGAARRVPHPGAAAELAKTPRSAAQDGFPLPTLAAEIAPLQNGHAVAPQRRSPLKEPAPAAQPLAALAPLAPGIHSVLHVSSFRSPLSPPQTLARTAVVFVAKLLSLCPAAGASTTSLRPREEYAKAISQIDCVLALLVSAFA